MVNNTIDTLAIAPSSLVMGCEPLGGTDWGDVDLKEAHAAVRCALDNGINAFDTADIYGLGRSEQELSKALGADRHNAFIITKFGVRWEQTNGSRRATTFKDSSPSYLNRALEDSLRRLKIEAVPLYLIHWPDKNTPLDMTLDALDKHQKDGKILSYGISNFDIPDFGQHIPKYNIAAFEGPYSLVDRWPTESTYQSLKENGIKTFTYGPLAQGLLTGKYNQNSVFPENDRRHRLKHFSPDAWKQNKIILETLESAAQHHSKTISQVAIRWILERKIVSNVIVGAKSPAQVLQNTGCLGWHIEEYWVDKLSEVTNNEYTEAVN